MDRISIDDALINPRFLIDVRSPAEFNHGHIPLSRNLPLFSDEERKIVGTTYKKLGPRIAIEKGLDLVSFPRIIQEIRNLELPQSVALYCARGGMRSSSMAWLFKLLGYDVITIDGGYKSFRKWVRDQFCHIYRLCVLGGETGSGKTKLLKALKNDGEKIIDLEGLANHRGSVFGGLIDQPTQEMFENHLAIDLFSKRDDLIWIEDESARIGTLTIPFSFFRQIRSAQMLVLQVPHEIRMKECLNEYLPLGSQKLSIAIHRLQKRLGGLETKNALDALEKFDYKTCCEILLRYYDKKYRYAISQKNQDTLSLSLQNKRLFHPIFA